MQALNLEIWRDKNVAGKERLNWRAGKIILVLETLLQRVKVKACADYGWCVKFLLLPYFPTNENDSPECKLCSSPLKNNTFVFT